MPDAPNTPPSAPPVTTNEPAKFAGKYETDEAAFKGVNEIRRSIGLKEFAADKPLYGENGHFPSKGFAESQYKEYEQVYHAGRAKPAAAPDSLSLKPDAAPDDDNEAPEAVLARANIKPEDAAAALAKGSLTDEQIAAIRKAKPAYAKLGKETINILAQGHYAKVQAEAARRGEFFAQADAIVGGRAQHEALREWAKTNIAAELADWNETVEAKPSLYPAMMRDLQARHAAAIGAGKAAPLISGSSNAVPSSLPTNRAEFLALMKRVNSGDQAALQTLARMPDAAIAGFNN